eukprot:SAG11_NODE_3966_length_2129_cov_4.699015_1_plen_210_part_00
MKAGLKQSALVRTMMRSAATLIHSGFGPYSLRQTVTVFCCGAFLHFSALRMLKCAVFLQTHATELMRPEHRSQIAENYKRKIETMVRKRDKAGGSVEAPEATSPCPNCSAPVPESELECGGCKFSIPFCVVTGKHVVADDYTACPSRRFDATYSKFTASIEQHKVCPMCNSEIVLGAVRKIDDPRARLLRRNLMDKEEEEAEAAAEKRA